LPSPTPIPILGMMSVGAWACSIASIADFEISVVFATWAT